MTDRSAIGVIAPQLSGTYFGTLLASIQAATRPHGLQLIAIQGTPAQVVAAQLCRDRIAGWIVINTAEGLEALAQTGAPFVTIGALRPELNHPAVFPDNRGGMREAVQHLLDHGHERIAFVGDLRNHDVEQRYEGYLAALADRGVSPDPGLCLTIDDSSELGGVTAFQRLRAAGLACTAVVGATDETALGILSAAQAAGYRVPDDLAVVGFDDIVLAASAVPPLTTVRVSIQALGRSAAELLIERLDGRSIPPGPTLVSTLLIPRRSCGCAMAIGLPAPADPATDLEWRARLARQLAHLIQYPVPADPETPLAQIWPAGERLIAALAAAIDGNPEVDADGLDEPWQQAVALTENIETLLAVLDALEQTARQRLALQPGDSAAQERVASYLKRARLALIAARMAPESAFLRAYSTLVHENYQISLVLLQGQMGEARQLAWLRQTALSWGCLGLWDTAGARQSTALIVAGAYRHPQLQDGALPAIGERFASATFPPADALPATATEQGSEIVMLLPIRSASHDWGVLAVTGAVASLRASGNYDALTALATLLSAALERDSLQQTLREAYERERALATTVRELGSPIIPLLPGVLLIPLIGTIDSARAQQIMETLLHSVTEERARIVLLDITGVPLVDTQVADALIRTARGVSLLGARVVLVGVRPEIAQSIVGLGIDLSHITTHPTLAVAIEALLATRR